MSTGTWVTNERANIEKKPPVACYSFRQYYGIFEVE